MLGCLRGPGPSQPTLNDHHYSQHDTVDPGIFSQGGVSTVAILFETQNTISPYEKILVKALINAIFYIF